MDKPTAPQTPVQELSQSPQDSETSQPEHSQRVDFQALSTRVFEYKNGVISIGGEELGREMLDILQQDARLIGKTQLWEILQATITNEAANLALIQSKDWSHVETAKMLNHWGYVFKNMLHVLSKD